MFVCLFDVLWGTWLMFFFFFVMLYGDTMDKVT